MLAWSNRFFKANLQKNEEEYNEDKRKEYNSSNKEIHNLANIESKEKINYPKEIQTEKIYPNIARYCSRKDDKVR